MAAVGGGHQSATEVVAISVAVTSRIMSVETLSAVTTTSTCGVAQLAHGHVLEHSKAVAVIVATSSRANALTPLIT